MTEKFLKTALNPNQSINQSFFQMAASITTHAQTNFDPQVYIDTLYTTYTGDKSNDVFVKFVLDSLHDVFKDGKGFAASSALSNLTFV